MKFSGKVKKIIAVVLSLAMIVTSITVYNTTAKAEEGDFVIEGITWVNVDGKKTFDVTFTSAYGNKDTDPYFYCIYLDERDSKHSAINYTAEWNWKNNFKWLNTNGGMHNNFLFDKVFTTAAEFAVNKKESAYLEEGDHKVIIAAYKTVKEAKEDTNPIAVAEKELEVPAEIENKNISLCKIEDIAPQEYTGKEIEPEIVIKDGEKVLEVGKDYVLEYKNNIKVGEATVVITSKGNYVGSLEKKFTIQKTIKLTVKEGKKVSVYTLGTKSSYQLPKNTKELQKQFSKLIKKGKVFKGFYKNGKKITKISDSTEVTLAYKNYRTLKTSVKNLILNKGIISFKFNKKDWKQIDGVEIIWAKNNKFKGKSKRTKRINTNGKKIPKLKYVIKKSDSYFRSGEYYCFRIRYYYKVGKKRYYYDRESRKAVLYGKRLVIKK